MTPLTGGVANSCQLPCLTVCLSVCLSMHS